MVSISKELVNYFQVEENDAGQRLDNFLFKLLKGVPKSHVQRIIRAGEVRINKKRCKGTDRLVMGDTIRIPPIRIAEKTTEKSNIVTPAKEFAIIYEDDVLLVINKPHGTAVHGGSGVSFGVIEQLRQARPESRYLELVHRLDKDTSGLLMIAKKRSALVKLHEMIRQNVPQKQYIALGLGKWPVDSGHIKLPLLKYQGQQGEKMVRVSEEGQYAHTHFQVLERFAFTPASALADFQHATLVQANLKTGRTHQIRVHMQSQDCPIAGDERYGDYSKNKRLQKQGLKRMFLHAYRLALPHPVTGENLELIAPLPKELKQFTESLKNESL